MAWGMHGPARPGDMLAQLSDTFTSFMRVLDRDFNAGFIERLEGNRSARDVPPDEQYGTMTIEVSFPTGDDARAFVSFAQDYQRDVAPGEGVGGDLTMDPDTPPHGLLGLYFDHPVEQTYPINGGRGAHVVERGLPTVRLEFVGNLIYRQHAPGPVCDAAVDFAEYTVANRLNADTLDGEHASELLDDEDIDLPDADDVDADAIIEELEGEEDVESVEWGGPGASPEQAADPDPETCPACGSENTVGFSTGDRVCRECNHNYDP